MRRLLDSKLYQVLDYIMRLILLNLLVTIVSLSFSLILLRLFENPSIWLEILIIAPATLTLFPSLVAMIAVLIKYQKAESNVVFKEFWINFKKHYLKSMIYGVLILVFGTLLFNSYRYFSDNFELAIANMFGLYATIIVAVISIFLIIHLPFCIINYQDLLVKHYIKLAMHQSFKHLLDTIIVTFVVVILIITAFLYPWVFIFGGFTIPGMLIVKLLHRKYK